MIIGFRILIDRKYRYMEVSLQNRRKALTSKIPDIEQTLSVVKFLQARRKRALGEAVDEGNEEKADGDEDEDDDLDLLDDDDEDGNTKDDGPLKTLFELNDTLFAEAEVQETGEVGIWLGVSPYCPHSHHSALPPDRCHPHEDHRELA